MKLVVTGCVFILLNVICGAADDSEYSEYVSYGENDDEEAYVEEAQEAEEHEPDVRRYEAFITERMRMALAFQSPTDASVHRADDSQLYGWYLFNILARLQSSSSSQILERGYWSFTTAKHQSLG